MKGTVVIISSIHWHSTWQRHQDIVNGLSEKGYKVIFVEPIPKRWPGLGEWRRVVGRLSGSASGSGVCLQPTPDGIQIITPKTVPDVGQVGRSLNAGFFVPRLAGQLNNLIKDRPLIVINYLPTSASLALQIQLKPDLAIYDCVTDWDNAPFTESLAQFEAQLLEQADIVFTDSPLLYDKMKSRHHKVVEVLPGVHFDRFLMAKPAHSSDEDDRPLCAYFGTMGASVDVELICAISNQYRLRLIGPQRISMACLSDDTDIRGTVPHDTVPKLLLDVDVIVLPYLDAPHMPAVIPAKTFECLATGIPTVAIGLSSLKAYADLFYLAESPEEFLHLIGQAVAEPEENREPRIACARQNSWETRINEIEAHIRSGLSEKTAVTDSIGEFS